MFQKKNQNRTQTLYNLALPVVVLFLFTGFFSHPVQRIMQIFILIFSLSFHEYSHARMAYTLGDPTAYRQGRLTLNPLAHLDPIGSLMILFAPVGWAKPVPVDPSNFYLKHSRKKGMALVSFAGPLSNLFLAFIAYFIFSLAQFSLNFLNLESESLVSFLQMIFLFITLFYTININLAIFNLLPIPPLDGFQLLGQFLPYKAYSSLYRYSNYFFWGILALAFITPSVFSAILYVVRLPFQYLITLPVDGIFYVLSLLL